jgi:hypothetical protein
MVKKTKLQNFADEIAKLERKVSRRHNQLEKLGVETDKPKKEKPKTVKQAKEIIFKMESYLRHTSTNASERKGAERGAKIRKEKLKAKQIDKNYNIVKKGFKKAEEEFMEKLANPINQRRAENNLPLRDFSDESKEFLIGLNPNKIKNKKYKKIVEDRINELALTFSKPNGHKIFLSNRDYQFRMNILHSIRHVTDEETYKKILLQINRMTEDEFYEHYLNNKADYDAILYDSDQDVSYDDYESYNDKFETIFDLD